MRRRITVAVLLVVAVAALLTFTLEHDEARLPVPRSATATAPVHAPRETAPRPTVAPRDDDRARVLGLMLLLGAEGARRTR